MESPKYIKTSMAAAMTLGLKQGKFYRNAKLYCINLLLTYSNGCVGRCGYCGLNRKRPGKFEKKSFIRVDWPTYETKEVVNRMNEHRKNIERVCISMVTNKRAKNDVLVLTKTILDSIDIPVSALITPTLLTKDDLKDLKESGVERLGIAIDLATEKLFTKFRGPVHKWEKYWSLFKEGLEVFGERMIGSHFMVGMGETEKQMTLAIQKIYDIGGLTHLFSFFPEPNSELAHHPQPPIDQYRRIQLAGFLIDQGISNTFRMEFDENERIIGYGIDNENLENTINSGIPFMTSGCPGKDSMVACNRPFANSLPGPNFRNFPFIPTKKDIERVKDEFYREKIVA